MEAKVKLCTKDYCPYCHGALDLLNSMNIKYINIDETHDDEDLKKAQEKENYFTIPMIYIKGKFIGGYTELKELSDSGKLKELVEE